MFEEKIIQLLNKVFSSYIEGIDHTKLSQMNLLGGKIVLNSLHVRTDSIDFLELPFHLTFGFLDSVTIKIQIPLLTLSRKNLSLEISDVLLLLTTKPESRWDPEWYRDEYISNKITTLSTESLELVVNQLEGNGFLWNTALSFLETLEVTIHNIHIRVEDYTTNGNVAYAFGCVIKSAFFKLNLDNPKQSSVELPFQTLFSDNGKLPPSIKHRTIDLEGFGLYIDQLDPYSPVKSAVSASTIDLGIDESYVGSNKQDEKESDRDDRYVSRLSKSFKSSRKRKFASKVYPRFSEAPNMFLTTMFEPNSDGSDHEEQTKTIIEHTNGMYAKVFSDVLNYLVTSKHDESCTHLKEPTVDQDAFSNSVWQKSDYNKNYSNKYQRRTNKIRTSNAFKSGYVVNGNKKKHLSSSFKSERSEDKYVVTSVFQSNSENNTSNTEHKNEPKLNQVCVSSSWRKYLTSFCDIREATKRMTKSSSEIINASLKRRRSSKFVDSGKDACDENLAQMSSDDVNKSIVNKNAVNGSNNESIHDEDLTHQLSRSSNEILIHQTSHESNKSLSQYPDHLDGSIVHKNSFEHGDNPKLSTRSGYSMDYEINVEGVDDILDEFERRRLRPDLPSSMESVENTPENSKLSNAPKHTEKDESPKLTQDLDTPTNVEIHPGEEDESNKLKSGDNDIPSSVEPDEHSNVDAIVENMDLDADASTSVDSNSHDDDEVGSKKEFDKQISFECKFNASPTNSKTPTTVDTDTNQPDKDDPDGWTCVTYVLREGCRDKITSFLDGLKTVDHNYIMNTRDFKGLGSFYFCTYPIMPSKKSSSCWSEWGSKYGRVAPNKNEYLPKCSIFLVFEDLDIIMSKEQIECIINLIDHNVIKFSYWMSGVVSTFENARASEDDERKYMEYWPQFLVSNPNSEPANTSLGSENTEEPDEMATSQINQMIIDSYDDCDLASESTEHLSRRELRDFVSDFEILHSIQTIRILRNKANDSLNKLIRGFQAGTQSMRRGSNMNECLTNILFTNICSSYDSGDNSQAGIVSSKIHERLQFVGGIYEIVSKQANRSDMITSLKKLCTGQVFTVDLALDFLFINSKIILTNNMHTPTGETNIKGYILCSNGLHFFYQDTYGRDGSRFVEFEAAPYTIFSLDISLPKNKYTKTKTISYNDTLTVSYSNNYDRLSSDLKGSLKNNCVCDMVSGTPCILMTCGDCNVDPLKKNKRNLFSLFWGDDNKNCLLPSVLYFSTDYNHYRVPETSDVKIRLHFDSEIFMHLPIIDELSHILRINKYNVDKHSSTFPIKINDKIKRLEYLAREDSVVYELVDLGMDYQMKILQGSISYLNYDVNIDIPRGLFLMFDVNLKGSFFTYKIQLDVFKIKTLTRNYDQLDEDPYLFSPLDSEVVSDITDELQYSDSVQEGTCFNTMNLLKATCGPDLDADNINPMSCLSTMVADTNGDGLIPESSHQNKNGIDPTNNKKEAGSNGMKLENSNVGYQSFDNYGDDEFLAMQNELDTDGYDLHLCLVSGFSFDCLNGMCDLPERSVYMGKNCRISLNNYLKSVLRIKTKYLDKLGDMDEFTKLFENSVNLLSIDRDVKILAKTVTNMVKQHNPNLIISVDMGSLYVTLRDVDMVGLICSLSDYKQIILKYAIKLDVVSEADIRPKQTGIDIYQNKYHNNRYIRQLKNDALEEDGDVIYFDDLMLKVYFNWNLLQEHETGERTEGFIKYEMNLDFFNLTFKRLISFNTTNSYYADYYNSKQEFNNDPNNTANFNNPGNREEPPVNQSNSNLSFMSNANNNQNPYQNFGTSSTSTSLLRNPFESKFKAWSKGGSSNVSSNSFGSNNYLHGVDLNRLEEYVKFYGISTPLLSLKVTGFGIKVGILDSKIERICSYLGSLEIEDQSNCVPLYSSTLFYGGNTTMLWSWLKIRREYDRYRKHLNMLAATNKGDSKLRRTVSGKIYGYYKRVQRYIDATMNFDAHSHNHIYNSDDQENLDNIVESFAKITKSTGPSDEVDLHEMYLVDRKSYSASNSKNNQGSPVSDCESHNGTSMSQIIDQYKDDYTLRNNVQSPISASSMSGASDSPDNKPQEEDDKISSHLGVLGMVFGGCPCFVSLSLISGTTRSCSIYVSSSVVTLPWEVIESLSTYFNSINAYIKDNMKNNKASDNMDDFKDEDSEFTDELESTDTGSQSVSEDEQDDEIGSTPGSRRSSMAHGSTEADQHNDKYSLGTNSVSDDANVGEDDSTLLDRLSFEGSSTPSDCGQHDVMNRQFYRTPEDSDKKFAFNVHVGISCMNLFTESAWTGYGYFLKYIYHRSIRADNTNNLKWVLIRNILRDKKRKAYMMYPITLNITGQGSLYLTHTKVMASDEKNRNRFGHPKSRNYGTMKNDQYSYDDYSGDIYSRDQSQTKFGNAVYRRNKFDMYCKETIDQMFEGWIHFMPCVFEVKLMCRNVSVKLTRESSGVILTPSGYTMCDLYLDISNDFRQKRVNFIKYIKMSLLMDKRYHSLVSLAKNSLFDPTNLNTSKMIDPFRSDVTAVFYLYGNDRKMWSNQIMPQSISVHLKLEPINLSINCIDVFCLMDFSNLLLSFFSLFKHNYTLVLHASDQFLSACNDDFTTLEKIRITKLFSKMEPDNIADELVSNGNTEYSSCVSSMESVSSNTKNGSSVPIDEVHLADLPDISSRYQSEDEYSFESLSNYGSKKMDFDSYETMSNLQHYYGSGTQNAEFEDENRYLQKDELMSNSSAEYEEVEAPSFLTKLLSTVSIGVSMDLELLNIELVSNVTSDVKHMFALAIEDTTFRFWVNNIFDSEYLDAKSKILSLEFGDEEVNTTNWFNDPLFHKEPTSNNIGDVDYENVAYLEQFSGVMRGGVLEMSSSSLSQAMKFKSNMMSDTHVIIDDIKDNRNIIIKESRLTSAYDHDLNQTFNANQLVSASHNKQLPISDLPASNTHTVFHRLETSMEPLESSFDDYTEVLGDQTHPNRPLGQNQTRFGQHEDVHHLRNRLDRRSAETTRFNVSRSQSAYSIEKSDDNKDVVILINDNYTRNNVRYSIVNKKAKSQKAENLIGVQMEEERQGIGLEDILHVDEMINVEKLPSIASFNKFLGSRASDDMSFDEDYYENRQLDQCYRENVKNFIQFRFTTNITIDLCREGNREMAVETFTVSLMGYKPSLATKLFSRLEASWINVNVTLNAVECYYGFLSYLSVMLKLRKMFLQYSLDESKMLDSVTKYTIHDQVPNLANKTLDSVTDHGQSKLSKEFVDQYNLGKISKDLSDYTLSKLSKDMRLTKDMRISTMFMDTKLSKFSVYPENEVDSMYSLPINSVPKDVFAKCICYRYFNGLLQPCGVMDVNKLIGDRLKAIAEMKFLGIKKIEPLYQSFLKFDAKQADSSNIQNDLNENLNDFKKDQDIYNVPIEHNVVHMGKLGHANVFGADAFTGSHSKLFNNLGMPLAVAIKSSQANHMPSINQFSSMVSSTTNPVNDFAERPNLDGNLRDTVLGDDSYSWVMLKDGMSCELPVGHYGILEPFLVRIKIGSFDYEITSDQLDLSYNDNQLMFKLDLNPKDYHSYDVGYGFNPMKNAQRMQQSGTNQFGVVRFVKGCARRLFGLNHFNKAHQHAYLVVKIEQKTLMQSSSTSSSSINIYITSGISLTNKSNEVLVVFPSSTPPENRTVPRSNLISMNIQAPAVSDIAVTKSYFKENKMTELDKLFKPITILNDHKLVKKLEPRLSARSSGTSFAEDYVSGSMFGGASRDGYPHLDQHGSRTGTSEYGLSAANSKNIATRALNKNFTQPSTDSIYVSLNKNSGSFSPSNSGLFASSANNTTDLQYIIIRGGVDNPSRFYIPLPWIIEGNSTICVALLSDFNLNNDLNDINEEDEQQFFDTVISCDVLLSREASSHIVSSFEGQKIKVPVPGFCSTLHLGKIQKTDERYPHNSLEDYNKDAEKTSRDPVENKSHSHEQDYSIILSCTLNEFTSVHKTQISLNPMKHCLKQYEIIVESCQIIENMMPYDINVITPNLYALMNSESMGSKTGSQNFQRAISFFNVEEEEAAEKQIKQFSRSISISTPQLVHEKIRDEIINSKPKQTRNSLEDKQALSIKSGTSMHLDTYLYKARILFKDFYSHELLFKNESTTCTLVFDTLSGLLLENCQNRFDVQPRPQNSNLPTKITVSVELSKRSTQPSKDKSGFIKRCLASSQLVCSIFADKWVVNWLEYPILLSRSDARYLQCFGGNGCSVVSQDLSNTGLHIVLRKNNLQRIHAYDMYKKKEKSWTAFRLTSPSHLISNKFVVPELTFSSCSIKALPNYPNLHYLISTSIAPMPFFRTVVMEILPQVTITNDFDLDIWIREYMKTKNVVKSVIKKTGIFTKLSNKINVWLHRRVNTDNTDPRNVSAQLVAGKYGKNMNRRSKKVSDARKMRSILLEEKNNLASGANWIKIPSGMTVEFHPQAKGEFYLQVTAIDPNDFRNIRHVKFWSCSLLIKPSSSTQFRYPERLKIRYTDVTDEDSVSTQFVDSSSVSNSSSDGLFSEPNNSIDVESSVVASGDIVRRSSATDMTHSLTSGDYVESSGMNSSTFAATPGRNSANPANYATLASRPTSIGTALYNGRSSEMVSGGSNVCFNELPRIGPSSYTNFTGNVKPSVFNDPKAKLSQSDIINYGLCEVETLVHKGCKMVRFMRPVNPEWMIINATGFNLYIQQLGILSHGEILDQNTTLKELNTTRAINLKDVNNRDFLDLELQNGIEYGWYDPQKEQKLIIKLYHLQDKNNDVLNKYINKTNINVVDDRLFVKVKGALLIDLSKVESINTSNMFNIKIGQMRLVAKLNAQTSVIMGQRTLILTCGKLNKLLARNKRLFDIYKQIKIKIPNSDENLDRGQHLLKKFKYNLKDANGMRVASRKGNNAFPFMPTPTNKSFNARSSRETGRISTRMLYLRNTTSKINSFSDSPKLKPVPEHRTSTLANKYVSGVSKEKEVVINISNDYTFNISLNGLGVCLCSYLPDELLYVSLVLVQFNTSFHENETRYEFSVGWLQSDVHDIESYFPTMVKPVINYSPFNIGSINRKKASSYVHHDIITNSNKHVINIVMNTKSNRYIKEISLLSIDIQPININLDTRIIFSTLLLLDDYLSVFSQSERSIEAFSAPHVGIFNYENMQTFDDDVYALNDVVRSQYGFDASKGSRYNISRLIIGKIVMVINIRRSESLQMDDLPLISPMVRYLIYIVRRTPHISDAHIVLNKESLLRLCCTPYVLMSHFGSRYISQAIHQIYKVLWAVDLIGNPKMIFNHWFSALYQSLIDFREALRFLHLPPVTFLLLLKGISQFGLSIISGIVDAFYRFTGSWCILLNAMALNSDRYAVFLLSEVFPKNFGHPSNVFEGLYFGTMMMGRNLYVSLGNFVFKPINSFNKFVESIRSRSGHKQIFVSFLHIWSSFFSSFLSLVFGSVSSALTGLSITLQGMLNQMHSVHMLSAIRPRRSIQHLKSTGPIRYNFLESWSMEASKRIGHTNQVLLVLPLDVKLKLFDPIYLATSHWSVLATHISSISPLILSQSFGNFKDLIWIDRLKVGYVDKGRIKWRYNIKSINRIQLVELNAELTKSRSENMDLHEIDQSLGSDEPGVDSRENNRDDDVRVTIYDSHFIEKKVYNRKLNVILPMKTAKKMLGKKMYFMRIMFSEPGDAGLFNWTEKKKIPLKLQIALQNPFFLQDNQPTKVDMKEGSLSSHERQIHQQIHENLEGLAGQLNELSISTHKSKEGDITIEPVKKFDNLYKSNKELIDINEYVKILNKIKYTDIDYGERSAMIDNLKNREKMYNGHECNVNKSELNEEEQCIYDKFNSIISEYTDMHTARKKSSESSKFKTKKMDKVYVQTEMSENEEEEWVEIIKMPNLETGKLYFTLLTSVIREVAL